MFNNAFHILRASYLHSICTYIGLLKTLNKNGTYHIIYMFYFENNSFEAYGICVKADYNNPGTYYEVNMPYAYTKLKNLRETLLGHSLEFVETYMEDHMKGFARYQFVPSNEGNGIIFRPSNTEV